jgi:hypothetical protein
MVCGTRHQSVEHVELADQVALPHPADRRIARHLSGVFGAERQQADARPSPRCGASRFTAGMAGPDNQNVLHEGAD